MRWPRQSVCATSDSYTSYGGGVVLMLDSGLSSDQVSVSGSHVFIALVMGQQYYDTTMMGTHHTEAREPRQTVYGVQR